MAMGLRIEELNRADRPAFVDAIGWVFERSPWVAERVWAYRPFRSIDELYAAMVSQVIAAAEDEQIELLRAHPELGARARMSQASEGEQAAAGLDSLSVAEFDRLTALNQEYKEKFGFPFVYAVKGRSKQDILDALERRLAASRPDELVEALRQVFRIARFRLEGVIA
jgi:OHCU decarboxylase